MTKIVKDPVIDATLNQPQDFHAFVNKFQAITSQIPRILI